MKTAENNNFNEEKAQSYDSKFSKISAIKDSLYLLTQVILSDVKDNAKVLCVGAGTGIEVLYLAKQFSTWQFDIIEPSKAMLKICIENCEQAGISSRCNYHLGELDSFVGDHDYNVATSFLVSHFITDINQRLNYFKSIKAKLAPLGILVTAELSGDLNSAYFQTILKVWRDCLLYSGLKEAEVNKMSSSFGSDVAVIKPDELESLLDAAGFDNPTLFYQALFIHSWFSRKNLKQSRV